MVMTSVATYHRARSRSALRVLPLLVVLAWTVSALTVRAATVQRFYQPGEMVRQIPGVAAAQSSAVVAATSDGMTVSVWQADTRECLVEFTLPTKAEGLAVSPDGAMVASFTATDIIIWDAATGAQRANWPIADFPLQATFSSDGARLACADAGGITIYRVLDGERIQQWAMENSPALLSFVRGDRYLLAAGAHQVAVWDLPEQKRIWTGHSEEPMTSRLLSADREFLLAYGTGSVLRWRIDDGAMRRVALPIEPDEAVALSPDTMQVACSSRSGAINIFDAHTGVLLESFCQTLRGDPTDLLVYSPDSRALLSYCKYQPTSDVRNRVLFSHDFATKKSEKSYSNPLYSITLLADGRTRVHIGSRGGIVLASLRKGKNGREFCSQAGKIVEFDYSPNASNQAALEHQVLPVYRFLLAPYASCQTPTLLSQHGHTGTVEFVTCSTKNPVLASAEIGSIAIWDTETAEKQQLWVPKDQLAYAGQFTNGDSNTASPTLQIEGNLNALALSRDGSQLAYAYNSATPIVLNLKQGEMQCALADFTNGIGQGLTFNRAGTLLVTLDYTGDILIWVAHTGALRNRLLDIDGFQVMSFSADDRFLAGATSTGIVVVYELDSGKKIATFQVEGAKKNIIRLGFTGDNSTLAAWVSPAVVHLWDWPDGHLRQVIEATGLPNASVVELSPQFYEGRCTDIAGDGRTIVLQENAHSFLFIDAESGVERGRITCLNEQKNEPVVFFRSGGDPLVSPDGKYVAFRNDFQAGTLLQLWDIDQSLLLWRLTPLDISADVVKFFITFSEYPIRSLTYTADSTALVVGFANGDLYWFDTHTGKVNHQRLKQSERITDATFSPNTDIISIGKVGGEISQWNLRTGKATITERKREAYSVTFSSGSGYYELRSTLDFQIINLSSGDVCYTSDQSSPDYVVPSVLGMLARQQFVVQKSMDDEENNDRIEAVSMIDRRIVWSASLLPKISMRSAISPNEQIIAVVQKDSEKNVILTFLHADNGRKLLTTTVAYPFAGYPAYAFSTDSKLFAIETTLDGKNPLLSIWDTSRFSLRTLSALPYVTRPNNYFQGFTADGRLVLRESKKNQNGGYVYEASFCSINEDTLDLSFALRIPDGVIYSDKYALSPDGGTIAYNLRQGGVQFWSTTEEGESSSFFAPTLGGNVHFSTDGLLRFSPDGHFLVLGNRDGNLYFWDCREKRLLGRAINYSDGSWAVFDQQGRYDASNGGDIDMLRWVVDGEVIALRQLKDRYYEPNLLAKLLGYNDEPLRDVASLDTVKLFPAIAVTPSPAGKSTLNVALTNRGGGIGKVRVLVNGKELTGDARGTRPGAEAAQATLTVNLAQSPALLPGRDNLVEVIAYNAEGTLASRAVALSWRAPGSAEARPPVLYGIVVGSADYAGTALDLRFAAKDAREFANALALGAQRLFGVDKVQLAVLTTEETQKSRRPTRANISAAFRAVARHARPDDILLVYFAGHATTLARGQDSYWYLTCEARSVLDLGETARRAQVAVSSEELQTWCNAIPALKQVMILDTCAAGAAADALIEKRDISADQIRAIERLKDRTGFHILMGCAADARSYETSQFGQGLLTYALLQGMKGAALRDEAFVDVSTLFNYVADAVPQLAAQIGGVQRPLIAAPLGASFDVGQLTPADRARIPLQTAKTLVLRPTLLEPASIGDPLRLTPLLQTRLRAQADQRNTAFVFLDTATFPGAVTPHGFYTIDGNTVTVQVKLWRDDAELATLTVSGDQRRPDALIEALFAELTRELMLHTGANPQ